LAKRQGRNLKRSTDLGELRFMEETLGRFYRKQNGGALIKAPPLRYGLG
jgi:hypothetical protein